MTQRSFLRPAARLTALLLLFSLVLPLSACGGASAATMFLRKTEGTVNVTDGEGSGVAPTEGLGLFSGYAVDTGAESFAWIDLDRVKLAKLDENSEIAITKEDKALRVDVVSGGLFFNVTEPLAADETMEICSSTMLVGIRGTCGWVTQNTAALLEGTVSVTAGEETVTVHAGEMAIFTQEGALEVTPFSSASVPAFVRAEVVEDAQLAANVLEAIGMDLSQYTPTPRYVEALCAENLDEVLYTEWIDFANDGTPELLVLGIQKREPTGSYGPDRDVRMYIFLSDDAESPLETVNYIAYDEGLFPEAEDCEREHSWSIVEADGRQFLEIYSYFSSSGPSYEYHEETARYYGLDAEGNWFSEHIHYTYSSNDLVTGIHSVHSGKPYGSESENRDCDPDDFAATRARYAAVRQLIFSPDGVTVTVTAP